MSALAKEYGTKGHLLRMAMLAYRILAFVALADRMVRRKAELIALVLPMTAMQGMSWQKASAR